MSETEEIKKRYERRKNTNKDNLYSYFNNGNLFLVQERQRKIIKLLNKYNQNDLANKKIFDIGCGNGSILRDFISWGAKPENLHGVDLLEERINAGRKISPNLDLICGDAEKLNYPEKSFNIITQFVCFTSILDEVMKKNIANKMLRMLKDDGIILWYDFKYNNPKNSDVQGIKKEEIKKLFPNCEYDFNLITLAPPLVRKLAPLSWLLCYLMTGLKVLNTHYLIIIRKKI